MAEQYGKLVQEDLNVGTAMVWITNPSRGELRATQIGLHSVARGQKQYTADWTPGAIAAGSNASTTLTVPDATTADWVIASHDKILTNDLRIMGHVSADDTAMVVIHNPTAAAITVPAGTVSVLVFPAKSASATVVIPTIVTGTVAFTTGGQPACPGTTVEVRDGSDTVLGTTTTIAGGIYTFTDTDFGLNSGDFFFVWAIGGTAPCGGSIDTQSNQTEYIPQTTMTVDIDLTGS